MSTKQHKSISKNNLDNTSMEDTKKAVTMNYEFCLSDEKTGTNYNGAKIIIDGIDINQFIKNPVALFNHDDGKVIGKWENIKKEGGKMTACLNEWDVNDPDAMEVKRKVDEGFIKGSSIGIQPTEYSFDDITDSIIIHKSTLLEASIVALPADKNAMKLYVDDIQTGKLELLSQEKLDIMKNSLKSTYELKSKVNKLIEENKTKPIVNNGVQIDSFDPAIAMNAVKTLISEVPEEAMKIENNLKPMEQEKVNEIVINHIEDSFIARMAKTLKIELNADVSKNENTILLKVLDYKNKLDEIEKNKVNDFISNAVTIGKILPGQKDKFIKMSEYNFEMVKEIIESMPNQKKLSDVIVAKIGQMDDTRKEWSYMEWVKNDYNGLQQLKIDMPEEYSRLLNESPKRKRNK